MTYCEYKFNDTKKHTQNNVSNILNHKVFYIHHV